MTSAIEDRQDLLNCLDEIEEHFDTIERVLLLLTNEEIPTEQWNSVLRAAHTAKGLSAMIGCYQLSEISHQLEDYLKILKIRGAARAMMSDVQTWLLQMLDMMRQIGRQHRNQHRRQQTNAKETAELPDAKTSETIEYLTVQLSDCLGQLTEGDEAALLADSVQTDITAVLFESEVEGLLQRLEDVLADPEQPCLREELDLIAQELMDLGQTLDLEAFTDLCGSIHYQVAIAEAEAVEAIARQAIKDWRQTQALILTGNRDNLPRTFNVESLKKSAGTTPTDTIPTEIIRVENEAISQETAPTESTVRVPIKVLTQLNDLFGELVIQRNTIGSRLAEIEELVERVSKQTGALDNIKHELRDISNRGAAESLARSGIGQSASKNPLAFKQHFDKLELGSEDTRLEIVSQKQEETVIQLKEATDDIKLSLRELKQSSHDIKRTTKELQINVTRATMRPFADVVKQFPRQVRELSAQYGKQVEFHIHGSSTLVDRHVLDVLSNPLMHLLRNAFDHGIERPDVRIAAGKPAQGRIDIWATHRSNQTLIFVQDDGAGIDLEKVRDRAYQFGIEPTALIDASEEETLSLIFEPGFSTAEQVSTLSGRGIGMDVVRTDLDKIRGTIRVSTQPGEGTTFTISVPFTLSTLRALMVEVGGIRLAFSTDSIQEVVRLKEHTVHPSPGQDLLAWEGLAVPLIRLDRWLKFNCPISVAYEDTQPIVSEPIALLVHHESGLKGLYIDRYWGEREIIIRQVENVMPLPPGFVGCTILEDGHAVPLADTLQLIDWVSAQTSAEFTARAPLQLDSVQAGLQAAARENNLRKNHLSVPGTAPLLLDEARLDGENLLLQSSQQKTVLVIDDSINVRRLIANSLEREGYRVEQAKDGREAIDKLSEGLRVQAVVCDVEMPRLDGYGFLAEVKAQAQFSNLPIVMLTSRSSEKHRQLAERLGAADYITKPYQDYQLLEILETQIEGKTSRSVV